MANATAKVKNWVVDYDDLKRYRTLADAVAKYYPGALLGENAAGLVTKLDDTAPLRFVGIQGEDHVIDVAETGLAAEARQVHVERPQFLSLLTDAAGPGDIGKLAYALYDNEVRLSPAGLAYANPVGHVHDVIDATHVLVKPLPVSRIVPGAARFMAATGDQSLTVFDLGKTIFVPNTAALTITLPPVAGTQPGDFLTIIKTSAASALVTIDGDGADTIDGAAAFGGAGVMDGQYDAVTLVSTGAEWVIAGRDVA